jgi:hypothetical protein
MRSESEVRSAAADFNSEVLRQSGGGCETCGATIEAVFDRITSDTGSVPILVIDIAHSDLDCAVLLKHQHRRAFPLGDGSTQVFCRHRFDDGDPAWRDSRIPGFCVCDTRRHDGPPCELHAPTRYPQ